MAGGTAMPLVVVVGLAFLLGSATTELPWLHHPAKPDGSVSLLVVGDWGRKGGFNQSAVAHQMGRVGERLDVDFIVSTGDNFYDNGLTGIDDEAFEKSFTKIYTAQSLQKPWYSVLGNHDYRGDVLAQLSPALREIDGRWICMRSFTLDAGRPLSLSLSLDRKRNLSPHGWHFSESDVAQFVFVDTTPFVGSYWTDPDGIRHDSRGVAPREEYVAKTLKDVEAALRASPARWKFVVGHHAIRSVSIHGDTVELVELLLPILKENGVDLYINGHDHCLEHISSNDSPIHFLTSGAGSKAWRGIYTPNTDKLRFFYDGQGFMAMELTRDRLEVSFYDVTGKVLHRWSTTKDLHPFM